MIRSLLGVGDGIILAMIGLTGTYGLRMGTVLNYLILGAGRYTDRPEFMPQLISQNKYFFQKKLLPARRQRVGTVGNLSGEAKSAEYQSRTGDLMNMSPSTSVRIK